MDYNANGDKTKDTLFLVDAKGNNVNSVLTYQYDPMDRLTNYTKTGSNARTESYVHDANSNVVTQTINGETTSYTYDRNRLVSTTSNGASAKYNYDVYGRLRSVTSAGILIEQNTYDGFDHVKEQKSLKEGSTNTYNVTKSFFDPMDRTTQKIEQVGTASAKTTDYAYLGLGNEVLLELQANKVLKSYQYSPTGKRIGMVNHKDTGDESSFYGYNPHTDVEMTYKEDGSVEGTYGYTAYGNLDKEATTGPDDPKAPDFKPEEPHNVYRYTGKRWDPGSQSYDMGFRDYSPGLNRFTTMDMYNGAFANMGLSSSPYTNNPYGFTFGNPVSGIEMDGHFAFLLPFAPAIIEGAAYLVTGSVAVGTGIAIADEVGAAVTDLYENLSHEASRVEAKAEAYSDSLGRESNECLSQYLNKNIEGKVKYGCTDLSQMAIGKRMDKPYWGTSNLAVVEFSVNGKRDYRFFKSAHKDNEYEPKRAGKHSEEQMHEWLSGQQKKYGLSFDVSRIYSERQPCEDAGHMCDSMIQSNYPDAKVTYSIPYRGPNRGTESTSTLNGLINKVRGFFGI